MIFALKWLPHCLQKMFNGNLNYFRTKFNIISDRCKEIPTICYYICKVDIQWCKREFNGIDISGCSRSTTEKSGFLRTVTLDQN